MSQAIEILGPKKEQDFNSFIWNNKDKVVYGPVDSRRLGNSLGINLFPYGKRCEFRCIYCDCGLPEKAGSIASLSEIVKDIEDGLRNHRERETLVDYITFSGNGEPTSYPWFPQVVEAVSRLRAIFLPDTPLAIFTNCMNLYQLTIRNALEKIDEVFFKVDAGDQQIFHRINRPMDQRDFADIVSQIARFKQPKISTAVIEKPQAVSNTHSLASKDFANLLRMTGASILYLYSIDYPTEVTEVLPTPLEHLLELANRISELEPIPIKILTTVPLMAGVTTYEK